MTVSEGSIQRGLAVQFFMVESSYFRFKKPYSKRNLTDEYLQAPWIVLPKKVDHDSFMLKLPYSMFKSHFSWLNPHKLGLIWFI